MNELTSPISKNRPCRRRAACPRHDLLAALLCLALSVGLGLLIAGAADAGDSFEAGRAHTELRF